MWGSNSWPRDQKSHALLTEPARRPWYHVLAKIFHWPDSNFCKSNWHELIPHFYLQFCENYSNPAAQDFMRFLTVLNSQIGTTMKFFESHRPKCAYDKSMSVATVCVYFAKQYWMKNRKPPHPENILALFAKNWNARFIILYILLVTGNDFWIYCLICHCQGLNMNQICKVFFLSLLEQNKVIVNTFKHFMTLESFLKKKKTHCQTN